MAEKFMAKDFRSILESIQQINTDSCCKLSENDKKIFNLLIKKENINKLTEDISNVSNMLEQTISEDDYWFQVDYKDVKDISEFNCCFTEEGRLYEDRLNIFVNFNSGEIAAEEADDYDCIDVTSPKFSENLKDALLYKAREMAKLKNSINNKEI